MFSNTQIWDHHPYASPEGPGTTPSEKCQGWSTARPLGAAMRHTALRQSYDSPRPMNSRKPKAPPGLKDDSITQTHRDCKPFSTDTGKYESAIPRYIPYGGAAQAPRRSVLPTSLPDHPAFHEGGCETNSPPNKATNNSPIISSQTITEHRPRKPENEMRQWYGGGRNARPCPPRRSETCASPARHI